MFWPGKGGKAGIFNFRARKIIGDITFESCVGIAGGFGWNGRRMGEGKKKYSLSRVQYVYYI